MPQNPFTYGNDDNQAEQQGWGPSGPRRSKTAFLASVFPVQQATPTQRQLPGAYAAPLQGEQQAQQPQGNFALSFNDEFAFLNSQQGTTPAFSNCPSPFFNPSPGQHDHTEYGSVPSQLTGSSQSSLAPPPSEFGDMMDYSLLAEQAFPSLPEERPTMQSMPRIEVHSSEQPEWSVVTTPSRESSIRAGRRRSSAASSRARSRRSSERVPCFHCSKDFPNQKMAERHGHDVHFVDRIILCPICSGLVGLNLRGPLAENAWEQEVLPPWKCNECGKNEGHLYTWQIMQHFLAFHYYRLSSIGLCRGPRVDEVHQNHGHFFNFKDSGHQLILQHVRNSNFEFFLFEDPHIFVERLFETPHSETEPSQLIKVTGLVQLADLRHRLTTHERVMPLCPSVDFSSRVQLHLRTEHMRQPWAKTLSMRNISMETALGFWWYYDGEAQSKLLRGLELAGCEPGCLGYVPPEELAELALSIREVA